MAKNTFREKVIIDKAIFREGWITKANGGSIIDCPYKDSRKYDWQDGLHEAANFIRCEPRFVRQIKMEKKE